MVSTSASRPVTGSGGILGTRRHLPRALAAVATVVVLTYLAVTSWPSLVASPGALTHLRTAWVAPLVAAQIVSMAAPALLHHRLLRAQGFPVAVPALLGITYASDGISVTLPLAGPEVTTAYTFKQLVRGGANSAVAGWTLLVSGVAAGLTAALTVLACAAATGNTVAAALAVGSSLVLTAAVVIGLRVLRRPATSARVEGAARWLIHRARRAVRGAQAEEIEPISGVRRRLAAHRLGYRDAATVGALPLTNWVADVLYLAVAIAAVGSGVLWTGLHHYCVPLAGPDRLRSTGPFPGNARAVREFNGDVEKHLNAKRSVGADPRRASRSGSPSSAP